MTDPCAPYMGIWTTCVTPEVSINEAAIERILFMTPSLDAETNASLRIVLLRLGVASVVYFFAFAAFFGLALAFTTGFALAFTTFFGFAFLAALAFSRFPANPLSRAI